MKSKHGGFIFCILASGFEQVATAHALQTATGTLDGFALLWFSLILVQVGLVTLAYTKGWRRWRLKPRTHSVGSELQPFFFGLGVFSLLSALLPPIDTLSEELASVHMVQHMLLMMVAAPLLIVGASPHFVLLGLPSKWRRQIWVWRRFMIRLGRPLMGPRRAGTIAGLYACILWLWHLPQLYQAALENRLLHGLQHVAFFGGAYFFWRVVLNPRLHLRVNLGTGILYLFVASLHSMALGVLMAVAPSVWYKPYISSSWKHGLSALEDQQIAGYIMWMPAGMTYVVVAGALMLEVLRRSESS